MSIVLPIAFTFLFFIVYFLLRLNRGIWYIIGIDIFIQIFTGNIDSSFTLLFEPSDWITLIIFVNFLFFSFEKKRKYFFKFNWIDRLVLFYFIIILLIPGLINLFIYHVDWTFKYFIPIRFWLIYRNYSYFFEENKYRTRSEITIEKILNYCLVFGAVSALISISRFFDYPGEHFIEALWPFYYEDKPMMMKDFGRLSGTMSGINGTGNYFCFLTAISLVKFNQKNISSVFFTILFATSVFLSGSFSSIAALGVILGIYFRKKLFTSSFLIVIIVGVGVFLILNRTEVFRGNLEKRVGTSGGFESGIIPVNLISRIGYWTTFTSILIDEERILFGLGPGGFFNYEFGKNNVFNQNAESFYFRILNESGLIALFYEIYFLLAIYKKIRKKIVSPENNPYQTLMKHGIIILLVAGVANETLYYGANTSLFGIFLSIIGYLVSTKLISKEIIHKTPGQNPKTLT